MKNAAEYLENQVFEARRPRKELQDVVTYTDAIKALEQALADAEEYKYLLMRALRRHAHATATPALIPVAETTVIPLYATQAA